MTGQLVLRDARLAGGPTEPVDLVLRGGRVAAIGQEPAGGGEVVDLAGRWVLPGLSDSHVHLTNWAKARRRIDLSGCRSAAEAVALVRDALGEAAPEVVGFGYRDALWPEPPTVAVLDAATGDRPVVLVAGDLHSAWLNSAALARHGLPPTDGPVREQAAFDVLVALDRVPDSVADEWVRQALQQAAGRGITRITDLEMSWPLADWPRRAAAGRLPVRVDAGFYPADLDRALAAGLRTGEPVPGTGGRVRVGPLKLITDGSLNTRTAWCLDPYHGVPADQNPYGVANLDHQEVVRLLATAHRHGLQVAVHAIGDRANQAALDAFEATGARGSIEHAQLLRPQDVGRFAALGVVASVQPEHAMDDRDVADRYWAGRTGRAFVLADLRRAGVTLRLGSDAPVAPLDPWVTMAAAVTRARDGRPPWHPEQAIDVATAIEASTDGVGVVSEAMVADLTVVERDPLVAEGLRTMPVFGTLLAGEWSYRS